MDLVAPKFQAMEDAFIIKMESEEVALLNEHTNADVIYDTGEITV